MRDPTAERIEFLRSVKLFSYLTDRMLEAVATRLKQQFSGPNYVLYRRGEQCLGLHILQLGEVRIFNVNLQGREQTANIMKARSVPDVFAFLNRAPHAHFATTLTNTRWLFLTSSAWAQVRRASPEITSLMMNGLVEQLDQAAIFPDGPPPLDHLESKLGDVLLTFIDSARIARTIPEGANSFDIDVGPPRALMRRVGTPKRLLDPTINRLKEKGLIDTLPDGRIRVMDLARLTQEVHASYYTV